MVVIILMFTWGCRKGASEKARQEASQTIPRQSLTVDVASSFLNVDGSPSF